MANTEGMSDEVVESLLGPSLSTSDSPRDKNMDAATRRRRALEEKMEMDMGERPAARVIRTSPKTRGTGESQEQNTASAQQQQQQQQATPPPIIGNIVERSKHSQPQGAPTTNGSGDGDSQTKKRLSRFAQQRQMGQSDTGFPSVHVPLGTFVKPKKKNNTTTSAQSSSSAAVAAAAASRSVPVNRNAASNDSANTSSPSNTASLGSLQQASSHDANAMFSQMTQEERFEKSQELQAALPAETIAFLRKRAAAKNKPKNNSVEEKDTPPKLQAPTQQQSPAVPDETAKDKSISQNECKKSTIGSLKSTEIEEKKRLAEILSKIRSDDDLDAAYQAEMGTDSPFVPSDPSNGGPTVDTQEKTDFQLACDLLRSTSPRQNLWAAQVVSKHLQEQWEAGNLCSVLQANNHLPKSPPWPYPVMLPASLRCLLDASVSQTNGYVLHTHVLQALYNLLRLRACPDHIVNVDGTSTEDAATIYQSCFLEDAIPTPAIGSCYEAIANVEPVDTNNNPAPGAAYKTSSSSTSAQKDGEAFAKDPMWTLLSRMCIIPRLAELLRIAAQTRKERLIPKEAIVSICGILAMIGQRSPGAGSAIVHHQTLLKHLLDISLMPDTDTTTSVEEGDSQRPYDPLVATPAMQLLCTLARQSRVTAAEIPFDDVVPPLLAMEATNDQEYKLQKWSVILWRILLRYGLGVPQISIMLTIATPHMALAPGLNTNSLSTEFSTSFANILRCVQVARRHASKPDSDTLNSNAISEEQFNTFLEADKWLESSARQVVAHLKAPASKETDILERMRVQSGHLQFLSSFIRAASEKLRLSIGSGESKSDEGIVFDNWGMPCQDVLASLIEQGVLKRAFEVASPAVFVLDFNELLNSGEAAAKMEKSTDEQEAVACAFLCSFASLQLSFFDLIKCSKHDASNSCDVSLKHVIHQFARLVVDNLQGTGAGLVQYMNQTQHPISLARRGWLNRACFSIIEVMIAARELEIFSPGEDASQFQLLRKLHFTLLGRLERGDEAMAVILFSQDSSFQPGKSTTGSAILSSMFFREMCSANLWQLDHSYKLRHGPGITPEEFGPFKLQSLLSDADMPVSPGKSTAGGEFMLPIGPLWLWQVLSSSLRHSQSSDRTAPSTLEKEQEAEAILSACMNLILELEEEEAGEGPMSGGRTFVYASRISPGAKIYHVMNTCLHPENLLQRESLISLAEKLFEMYACRTDSPLGLEFARACSHHSGLNLKTSYSSDSKTEKLATQLLEGPSVDNLLGNLSKKELRALEEFSGDLSEVYLEYGAQYDFFTRFIRLFFLPTFHPKIRCQVMKRVGEVMHFVTLPGEDDASSENYPLHQLLEKSILGALPNKDGSTRDSPDFLDALAIVYSKGGTPRLTFGYVFLLGVLVHSRHLAICLQPGSTGLDAARKRLHYVQPGFALTVVDATERFLNSSDHSKTQLVTASFEAVNSFMGSGDVAEGSHQNGNALLDAAIEQLKSTRN